MAGGEGLSILEHTIIVDEREGSPDISPDLNQHLIRIVDGTGREVVEVEVIDAAEFQGDEVRSHLFARRIGRAAAHATPRTVDRYVTPPITEKNDIQDAALALAAELTSSQAHPQESTI